MTTNVKTFVAHIFLILIFMGLPSISFSQGSCIGHPTCSETHSECCFEPGTGRLFNDAYRLEPYVPPQPYGYGMRADPVFAASGAFVEKKTDLKVKSIGGNFTFTRTWTSTYEYSGPMGPGWDFVFNQRIWGRTDSNGNKLTELVFYDGTGRSDPFFRFDQIPGVDPTEFRLPTKLPSTNPRFSENHVAFVAPSPAELIDPPELFYPTRKSGLTEVLEVFSAGAVIIRHMPGGSSAHYELTLRLDQVDALNNSNRLNQIIEQTHGTAHVRHPTVIAPPWLQIMLPDPNDRFFRLSKTIDRFGNEMSFQYESGHPDGFPLVTDKLTSIKDTQNRQYDLTYYPVTHVNRGLLRKVTDFLGRSIKYNYDSNDRLTEVVTLFGKAQALSTLYTWGPIVAGFSGLETRENPREATDSQNRRPVLRNRYLGRSIVAQEYGEAAVTPTMGGDPGAPVEAKYSFQTVAFHAPVPVYGESRLLPPPLFSMIKKIQFTDRNGTIYHEKFSLNGELTSTTVVDNGRSYTTARVWTNGRLTTTIHPSADPNQATWSGRKEIVVFNDSAEDPRQRAFLLSRQVIPESGPTPVGGEAAQTWTYSNYHPTTLLSQNITEPDGSTVERNFAVEGDPSSPSGYLTTETTKDRQGAAWSTEKIHQDSLGRTDWIEPADGVRTSYIHVAGTNLVAEEYRDTQGLNIRSQLNEYNARGLLKKATDSVGQVIKRSYDRLDQLSEERLIGLGNPKSVFTYDGNGQVIDTLVYENGVVVAHQESKYDILEQVIESKVHIDATREAITTHEFDAGQREVKRTLSSGLEIGFEWTSTSLLKKVTRGLGLADAKEVTFAYDHNEKVINRVDAEGGIWSTIYDLHSRLSEKTNPTGQGQTVHYSGTDLVGKKTVGSDGVVYAETKFLINDKGRRHAIEELAQTEASNPIGDGWMTKTSEFDVMGKATKTTDEVGNVARMTYDALGRTQILTDPAGNTTMYSYLGDTNLILQRTDTELDENGQVAEIKTWAHEYDDFGNRSKTTGPTGLVSLFWSDFSGRLTKSESPEGQIIEYSRDLAGNVISVTRKQKNSNGSELLISSETTVFDLDGVVLRTTNALGDYTDYDYDNHRRLTQETLSDLTTRQWDWNSNDQITKYTNGAGSTFDYTYDAANRRTTVIATPGSVGVQGGLKIILYEYDEAGRLLRMSDADSTVTRSYNSLGNMEEETVQFQQLPPTTIRSHYDIMGKRTSFKLPNIASGNHEVHIGRDELTRQSTASLTTSTTTESLAQIAFEGRNRVTSLQLGINLSADLTFDTLGSATSVTWSNGTSDLVSIERINDQFGRTQWRRERYLHNSLVFHENIDGMAHDAMGRLEGKTEGVSNPTWNVIEVDPSLIPTTFSESFDHQWNAVDQLSTTVLSDNSTLDYVYSSPGDLTNFTSGGLTETFYFNDIGQRASESGPQGMTNSHEYDVFGRLIKTAAANGDSYEIMYDVVGRPSLHVQITATTTIETVFAFDGNAAVLQSRKLSASTLSPERVFFYLENTSTPYAVKELAGTYQGLYFVLPDEQGNVTVVTDVNGSIVQHYRHLGLAGEFAAFAGVSTSSVSWDSLQVPTPFISRAGWSFGGNGAVKNLINPGTKTFDVATSNYLQRVGTSPSAGGMPQPVGPDDDFMGSFPAPPSAGPSPWYPDTTGGGPPGRSGGGPMPRPGPGPGVPEKRPGGITGGGGTGRYGGGTTDGGFAGGGGGGGSFDGSSAARPPVTISDRTRSIGKFLGMPEEDIETLQKLIDRSEAELSEWFAGSKHADKENILITTVSIVDGEPEVESFVIWDGRVVNDTHSITINDNGTLTLTPIARPKGESSDSMSTVDLMLGNVEGIAGFLAAFFPPIKVLAVGVATVRAGISVWQGDYSGAASKLIGGLVGFGVGKVVKAAFSGAKATTKISKTVVRSSKTEAAGGEAPSSVERMT